MRAFLVVSVLLLMDCRAPPALDGSAAAPAAAVATALAPVAFGGGLRGGTPNPDARSAACAGGRRPAPIPASTCWR